MEKIQNLMTEIAELTNTFVENANSNLNGNKAAGCRARKATLALTKLFKEYRALTVKADKV